MEGVGYSVKSVPVPIENQFHRRENVTISLLSRYNMDRAFCKGRGMACAICGISNFPYVLRICYLVYGHFLYVLMFRYDSSH